MFLLELHNAFFANFENRIASWRWNEAIDATPVFDVTKFIPVLYPYAQPTNRKVLKEYQTTDSDKEVEYPFIQIDPLIFYRDTEVIYNDETYQAASATTVSTIPPPVRYVFPYRVSGVSTNMLDHTILAFAVLEQIFPLVQGQSHISVGTTLFTLKRELNPDETKDTNTGVHQFSVVFNIYINLVAAPIVTEPSIDGSLLGKGIKLNIYEEDVLAVSASIGE